MSLVALLLGGRITRGSSTLTGPSGSRFERLLEDAHRLAHLLHADEVAIVDVAVRADRHVEVVRLVAEVRAVLAHVVGDAATRAASGPTASS